MLINIIDKLFDREFKNKFQLFQELQEYNEEDIDKWDEAIEFFEEIAKYYALKYNYFLKEPETYEEECAERRSRNVNIMLSLCSDYKKTLIDGIYIKNEE